MEVPELDFYATFFENADGEVIGLRRDWVAGATSTIMALDVGRIIGIIPIDLDGTTINFANAHLGPAYDEAQRRRILHRIRGFANFEAPPHSWAATSNPSRTALTGWTCIGRTKCRPDRGAKDFGEVFAAYVELERPTFARKKLVQGCIALLSRLERW